MPTANVIGLDHVVIVVRYLATAAEQWRDLGFTISPLGVHSEHMGTANHTLMFEEDYLELMGVMVPTDRNAPMRERLEHAEGIDRAAFTSTDAEAGVAALKARGFTDTADPVAFARPVILADGTETEAQFHTFQWPLTERPGGVRLFACQHHTRDAVWLPELTTHANGAIAIRHIEVLDPDPAAAAAHLSRLIDEPVQTAPDGAHIVASGSKRASFHFVDLATLQARHPGVALDTMPAQGGATISIRTNDITATASALGLRATETAPNTLTVAPHHANGVVLQFVQD